MFHLRDSHRAAFQRTARESFEDGVRDDVREMCPDRVRDVTDRALFDRIRGGRNRARTYGLTTRRQVAVFVSASYLLGERYDTDPQYPWARNLLTAPLGSDDKADCLLASARAAAGG